MKVSPSLSNVRCYIAGVEKVRQHCSHVSERLDIRPRACFVSSLSVAVLDDLLERSVGFCRVIRDCSSKEGLINA